jgi:hypothetical protein
MGQSVEFPLVPRVMRTVKLALGLLVALLALWFEAVRHTPEVKRRKAARRRARLAKS